MGKRKQQRHALTVQLIAGVDDDLIQWAQGFQNGTRQQAVKYKLRQALDLPIPAPPSPAEVQALRAEFEAIRLGNSDAARVQQLEDWMQQMATAYNELVQRIDQLGSLPAAALTSSEPMDSAPQITQEQQQARANKLKKAKW